MIEINKEKIALVAIEAAKKKQAQAEREAETRRTTAQVAEALTFSEQLLRIAHSTAQKRREYEAWARPHRLKKCEEHNYPCTINFTAGFEVSNGLPKEDWVLIYNECPKCVRDSQTGWLRLAGVPSNMLHCTLDNWRPQTNEDKGHLLAIEGYLRVKKGFAIITGADRGIGKTHLAVAIMREFRCGMFRTQLEFFEQYQKRFQPNTMDMLERAKAAKLLVMDDFGLRTLGKNNEASTLHSLFDHRYGESKATIITSNDSYETICRDLGPRLEDRLKEAAFCVLELHGESKRGQGREKYSFAKTAKAGRVR